MAFESIIQSLTYEQMVAIVLLILFPGIVFMHILRLFFAIDKINWSTGLMESAFWGTINFVLVSIVGVFIPLGSNSLWLMVSLFVLPFVVPPAWYKLVNTQFYKKRFTVPYDTAFDYAINTGKLGPFVVIHLKSGKTIAGYFENGESFVTATPHSGDLFLSIQLQLDEQGKLIRDNEQCPVAVPCCNGILVRADEYSYLEIFDMPKKEKPKQ